MALREALSLAERVLESPEQALELAGWGLERAVTMGSRVAEWHAEVDRLGATSGQWRAVFQRIASTIDPGPEGEAA